MNIVVRFLLEKLMEDISENIENKIDHQQDKEINHNLGLMLLIFIQCDLLTIFDLLHYYHFSLYI